MRIEELTKKASVFFQWTAITYFFVSIFYFMSLPAGGDEVLFVSDLQLIKNVGWYNAIVKNVSIPYVLIAYPLSLVLDDFIALKVINLILIVFLFVYLRFYKKNQNASSYWYLLFFISTVGYFFFATNDCLFFICLIIFFNEVHDAIKTKEVHFNLALIALIIAFFTRELFLVYLPIIIIGSFILYRSGCRFTTKSFFPLGLFILLLLLNIPSLEKNGHLSYDRKAPPHELGVSWAQRQYLAQLMVNKGELENFQHPTWEQTKAYIDKNGEKSLPNGVIEGLTFDFQLTIKEFFKDFGYCVLYSFRSLGLMLLITLGYWLMQKKNTLGVVNFVPFSTLLMLMIFSFIIISYVELRWLSAVFVLTIIYYSDLQEHKRIPNYLILSNMLVLSLLSLYGMIRIYNKI